VINKSSASSLAALCALGIAFAAGCAGNASLSISPGESQSQSTRYSNARIQSHTSASHLYVSLGAVGEVLRYPIVGGVVSSTADLTLNVPRPGFPSNAGKSGIAIDAQGRLYVSGYGQGGGVAIFAAGASGNATPLKILAAGATDVKVDSKGFVYTLAGINFVNVYAPGTSTPKGRITVTNPESLALGSGGDLYIASEGEIARYSHPSTNPQLVSQICVGDGPSSGPIIVGLAVGAFRGRPWIYGSLEHPGFNAGKVGVWSGAQDRPCPARLSQHLIRVSGFPAKSDAPAGLAIDVADNALFVADLYHGVYQVNPLVFSRQTPVASFMPPGNPGDPYALAVGP
jgi:hypothetical protein